MRQQLAVEPYGQEDDDYDEEDEEEVGDNGANMIIINEQLDDDKKVVYLSNINSCSLPQTPKVEESKKQSVEDRRPIYE